METPDPVAANDSQLAPPTMGDHEDEARRSAAYGDPYVPDEFEERNPRDEINRWRRESELYMRLFGEFRDALTPFAEYLSREKSIYGFDEKDLKPVRDLVKRGLIYVE